MTAPTPSARELRARQAVLAAGTLDAWHAKFEKYQTTQEYCQCPDYNFHWHLSGFACKHMIAFRLLRTRPESEGS